MRKLKHLVATIIAFVLCVSYLDGQASKTTNKPDSTSVHEEIHANPEKIRAHVKFLASDLLEGRGTGQRGGDIAAEYIAAQFALDGLQPAGDKGTYFQDIPMIGVKTLPSTSFKLVP